MSLIIDDSYIEKVKKYMMDRCDDIGSIISQYEIEMNKVTKLGIMEGQTASALKEFATAIKSDLSSNSAAPQRMDAKVERYCINFVNRVDVADKQIY